MHVTAVQKFPTPPNKAQGQTAFDSKGAPHQYQKRFPPTPFPTYTKQPVVPFAKPSLNAVNANAGIPVAMQARAAPQFPPTPSTIIKSPRFYSNQSLIIPRSKPNFGGSFNASSNVGEDCICERDDAIIICQKCGSELLGRVQQKCAAHPRKIPLMDHRECLNAECRSIKLVEISMDEGDI